MKLKRREIVPQTAGFSDPEQLTPYSLVALLRRMHSQADFNDSQQSELLQTISQLEKAYFAPSDKKELADLNLDSILQHWMKQANKTAGGRSV